MKLAWLGLGAMGGPMAANLAARYETLVWNRTAAVAEDHAARHDTTAVDLEEIAAADVILSCLPTTVEVAAVAGRLADHLRDGTIWIDHTSGDPSASRELAQRLAAHGVTYLDAPVSGGTDGAHAGTLTVMVGGDGETLERVREVLDVVGALVVHVGPVGAGHAVKAVNNTLLAVNLWTAAEGLAGLVRAGVDAHRALQVINASSGRSNATENLFPDRVLTREFPATFALALLLKDVRLGVDVLDDAAVPAPVLRQVAALLPIAVDELGPDVDHTALVQLVERWSGTEIA